MSKKFETPGFSFKKDRLSKQKLRLSNGVLTIRTRGNIYKFKRVYLENDLVVVPQQTAAHGGNGPVKSKVAGIRVKVLRFWEDSGFNYHQVEDFATT